jgi:DNA-binding SARP family transcriptional activator
LSTGIRGKARELMTFLAVHSDGAARDAILSALWPDIDQRHAVMRFHAAVNDVRRELRRASGLANESFISVIAERYRIDPDLLSVDLWRFRTALHQASRADDERVRAGLLQEAIDSYTGHLAAEQSYEQSLEWIEPEREALRRQAVEALIHLAELREHDQPEHGLAALERARSLDGYAEEIYQRIMTLQARLGRPDAVRRTYRLLETALEELGADPSQETQQLLWRLLHPRGQAQPGHRY